MRITYLHQYFATPGSATGTRSYELARRLVARGHRVTVICSDAQLPVGIHSGGGVSRSTLDGIDLVVIGAPYRNEMGYRARIGSFTRFAIRASIEAARTPADLVFATSTPLTIAIPGLVARIARRVPLVFEVRDLWPELPIAVGALRNPALIAAARALEWAAYHGAARVIALSPGMAAGVAARGVAPDRITVVPNGCDRETFDVSAGVGDVVRASLPGLVDGAPLIVYVGAFGRINGADWLADLAAATRPLRPDARFLMIGAGWGRDALLARARTLGVLDETLFVRKPVPKRDVPAILAAATVATSLFRPVPAMEANSANKFFDALAAGRPILINYGGWHRELLETHGAGIAVSHGDPRAAAAALTAFLADPTAVARAGDAARTVGREQFDRDLLAERFAAVLESS